MEADISKFPSNILQISKTASSFLDCTLVSYQEKMDQQNIERERERNTDRARESGGERKPVTDLQKLLNSLMKFKWINFINNHQNVLCPASWEK
jgi:hypothetical protein